MLKNKSVDIIKTFTKDELKQFESFVQSPYFNTSKSIVRLLKELKIFYPEFNSEKLTEEFLYRNVYGKEKYSYSAMRNLMSEMLQLCERFLLHNRLNKDIFKSSDNILNLLDEYQTRNISNLFKVRLKNIEKDISKEKFDFYFYKNKINILNFILDEEYNKVSFKSNIKDIFFKKAIYELCGIANSLYRNANSIYYSSLEYNVSSEESYFFIFLKCIDIEKFLKEIRKIKSGELVILEIYFMLVQLILNPENDKNYFEVKKLIFDNISKFSNKEKYSLLNILRNYLLFEVDKRETNFDSEAKSINIEMLESIDFNSDKMESILGIIYISVFLQAISKEDYKFAEEFINKYSKRLRKEIRKDVFAYSSAYINYVKKNYGKALELLSTAKPPNMVYFVQFKHLYLKIYFDLEYYDEGLSVIDSYRHYLDKQLKNQKKKKSFMETCRLYLRLYKIKSDPDKFNAFDVDKLIRDLDLDELNIEKKWILEKAKELRKIYR